MVKIRLKRIGKKKQPFYRIVVADARVQRDSRYIEKIGFFNPKTKLVKIDHELALKWMRVGTQLTPTIKSLFQKEKLLKKFHNEKLARKTKKIKQNNALNDNETNNNN